MRELESILASKMNGTPMTDSLARESVALRKLQKDIQSVDDVAKALKEEIVLFQRTMYKNHSQHRRAAFYKHMQEVKRSLKDIAVRDVLSMFAAVTDVLQQLQLQPNEHHISWKALAGDLKVKIDTVLRQLAEFALKATQIITAAQKAYKGLAAQFAMTYFMPFALTTNSILGRLTLLFKTLLIRTIEAHGGVTLLYLNEVTKSNPLRARVTAVQLSGYRIAAEAIEIANA